MERRIDFTEGKIVIPFLRYAGPVLMALYAYVFSVLFHWFLQWNGMHSDYSLFWVFVDYKKTRDDRK